MPIATEEEPLEFWSTFSGVGGIDLGLERAGMRCGLQAESDSWCRAVLAARFPGVPCLADVRDVAQSAEGARPGGLGAVGGDERDGDADRPWPRPAGRHASRNASSSVGAGEPRGDGGGGDEPAARVGGRRRAEHPRGGGVQLDETRAGGRVDVLCGGFPCQDVSVAGKRAGLDGARSGLFHEFARITATIRPTWVLLENVPGLLTSNGGRDFGVVLGTLAELGYGLAWRVLDSRYFGVPQRRRRVFIVGHIGGDDGPALRALCEGCEGGAAPRECSWSPPPAGPRDGASPNGKGRHYYIEDGEDGTLKASGAGGSPPRTDRLPLLVQVSPTLQARHRDGGGYGPEMPLVASTLSAGSGEHRPGRRLEDDVNLVPQASSGHLAHSLTRPRNQADHDTLVPATYALQPDDQGKDRGALRGVPIDVAPTINRGDHHSDRGARIGSTSGVRRLTPRECERLQAFPDDWTLVDGLKCPDSRRYGAMGNAVTVNVAEWIGRGIAAEHRRGPGKVGPSAAWG